MEENNKSKLTGHLIIRFLVVSFILAIVYYSYKLHPFPVFNEIFKALLTLVLIAFIFTAVSFLILKTIKKTVAFTYYQILFETIFISGIVFLTGVSDSSFYFLYYLSIISSSILLEKKGAFYTATIASLLYGVIINIDYYKIYPGALTIESPFAKITTPFGVSLKFFISATSFYVTALLTSYLISIEKKTKEALEKKVVDYKKLEKLYIDIISNISSGIFTVNMDKQITSFNKGAEEITGYSLGEVYLKNMGDIFTSISEETYELKLLNRFEAEFNKKDGKQLFLGFSVSSLKKDEKEEGKIFIFQDLTEIRTMEEKLEKSETLALVGQMAAGIAHEIRNPLASISGSIEFLKEELAYNLTKSQKELFNILGKETGRLNQLINDFFSFAKPKEPELAEVDICRIIDDVLLFFRKEELSIEKKDMSNKKIIGDKNQISQVLINLLKNAEESLVSGKKGTISLYTKDNGQFLSIVIEDNGCGIKEENIKHLFKPFFTTKASGTGLGLAIVKGIVEAHNGNITVESSENIGTKVTVNLPIRRTGNRINE